MAIRLLKIAAVYFVVGVASGLVMGVTHRFQYAPVHAHLNLLGWASLALAGLIYHHHPRAARTKLAHWHFWLHNLGLPVFMLGLFLLLSGRDGAEAVVRIGASMTFAGVMLFVVNVIGTVRAAEVATAASGGTNER